MAEERGEWKKKEILVILNTPEVPRSSPKFPHKSKSKFLFLGEDGCIAENKSEMLAFPPKKLISWSPTE